MRLEYQADNKYNQSCKNNQKKIYHTRTLSISKTHSINHIHSPSIRTPFIFHLSLKTEKPALHNTHLLQNTHWWEQSSQLLVMMTKVIITQEWIKIVKILFIHSKYWTIHCSLTHTHPNSNTHPIQKHSPSSKTLSISHLSLKTEKPALHNTIQHTLRLIYFKILTGENKVLNWYWWEQCSQLLVMMSKVIITQEWIKL